MAENPPIAGYVAGPLDEAVAPDGMVRPDYREVLAVLQRDGSAGLTAAVERLDRIRAEQGVTFRIPTGGAGGLVEQVFPMDPVPRLIGAEDRARLEVGVTQRARALNAFLDDVYRTDDDGSPARAEIVAAGLVPERFVRGAPGFRREATDLVPGGRPRATVAGFDLLTGEDGRWVVLEDNLQVPSGLAYVLANRAGAAQALPDLHAGDLRPEPPDGAVDLLRRALLDAAPPGMAGDRAPKVAVLSDGPDNSAWYEHRTLAERMGVPVVALDDLLPDGDGVAVRGPGGISRIDVLYRRFGHDDLLGPGAARELVRQACRSGTLALANAPGNGVADDKAIYAFVGPMIRFYLGEEPALADVGTWVLAEPGQYDAVRGRLGSLVVKPVDGSGGDGVRIGPELTAAQIEQVESEVAARPERFIAQEVIRFSTHPTVIDGSLRPRHVDLRLFVLSGRETRMAPGGLSRVALGDGGLLVNSSQGGGSKDTWFTG
ncbi:circularly permuted type 2 ATP-grasp protein [Nakamurella sp. YIM 132087]|uniref:Circularly permuted type 2 ATP-grasp protein n=1 Tax=Nakamurella alba TaxID=2665158 RepID=A0A7K1FU72_9ACTN|nr:circularly permuted type 2 ATP-grasp protein [Nakamurella alba]MTD16384.1 circularly permuted type 2 ATP-grasp protein [Nakamurella alba]